ncbi:MAG TPA: DNA polymerase ligase N-terminal domain-containing protein, partial [Patescibacteria group bacterium]|nr:DNA polymerase ligase N-terminal domain-containing protein [Patescibacteria group bacterium]
MSLADYQKKRHFMKTPEPKGRSAPAGKLRFVVQKHAASHLHYDFRLEWDGVLKSWAVPRGPSLNPQEKRLAMMTEDHPLDYRTFEGVIPPGNYGAGTVMVWDEGGYRVPNIEGTAETEHAMRAGFHKGEIQIELMGKKLHGIFLLIKLRTAKEDNAWLLIKKQDAAATKIDIRNEDRSAASGRTMEEIAGESDQDDLRTILKSGRRSSMPARVDPMLAKLADKPFDDSRWGFEIKWDGYRIVAFVKRGKVILKSRNQQNYTGAFQVIADELATIKKDAVFDGEMVVLDQDGIPRFQLMQNYLNRRTGSLTYEIFDVLYADGYDVRALSLED